MAHELRLVYNEKFFSDLDEWFLNFYHIKIDFHLIQNDESWSNAGIRERQRLIGGWLNSKLQFSFEETTLMVERLLHDFHHANYPQYGLVFLCIPEILLHQKDISFEDAFLFMEKVTQWVSCEFVVRDFLRKDFQTGMKYLKDFSKHQHPNVRRLASEGCRPNLPWDGKLQEAIQFPEKVLEVLENLMHDTSKFVQTSVANNLNDFSKIYPNMVLDWCKRYKGSSKEADWIIKKALRTLIKCGNKEAITLIELPNVEQRIKASFKMDTTKLIDEKFVVLRCEINNLSDENLNLRVDYLFSYPLKNGSLGKKFFMLKEFLLKAGETITLSKKHSFKDLSTRKHFAGEYSFSLVINGKTFEKKSLVYNG